MRTSAREESVPAETVRTLVRDLPEQALAATSVLVAAQQSSHDATTSATRVPTFALLQAAAMIGFCIYGIASSWQKPLWGTGLQGVAIVLLSVASVPALRRLTDEQNRHGEWFALPWHVRDLFFTGAFRVIGMSQRFASRFEKTQSLTQDALIAMVFFLPALMFLVSCIIRWPRKRVRC